MPISPKDLISTVVEQGRKVVSGATGRFRRDSDSSESSSPTAGTTRSQRAKASGTSARKPATVSKPKTSKAKTTAAKSKTSAAKTPGGERPQAGTSRSTAKPDGDGASAPSSPAKDTAPAGEQKSS